MKPLTIAIAIAATAASFGLAYKASAYTLTPPGPASAHGMLLAVTPGQRQATPEPSTWAITVTSKGVGKVTSLTTSAATFGGFPWAMHATGLNALTIKGVGWFSPTGACGPVTLHATLAGGTIGVEYFDPATGCELEGGFATMPSLGVGP